MAANIKPLKMCINITIPSVEDTDLSLYEAMCTLAEKLQDTIKEINEILADVVVTVNGKQGPNVVINGDDISVSGTDDQSISGVLSQKYSDDNPPPYPVTSVAGKTGDVTLTAENIDTNEVGTNAQDELNALNAGLLQTFKISNTEYTSWDNVKNLAPGAYKTSGFLPWASTISASGCLIILRSGNLLSSYIYMRDDAPNMLYFGIANPTSSNDWYLIQGSPISG